MNKVKASDVPYIQCANEITDFLKLEPSQGCIDHIIHIIKKLMLDEKRLNNEVAQIFLKNIENQTKLLEKYNKNEKRLISELSEQHIKEKQ